MERRSFLRWLAVVSAWGASGLLRTDRWSTASGQGDAAARFVAPPQEETPEIAAAIDRVTEALKAGRAKPSDILSNPEHMALHPWPRFRQAIRDHAVAGPLTIVTPGEPGTPLTLEATVLDSAGKPVKAWVYLYQTSAKGWYSDQAAHVSGNSGDQRYARLFGYLLTDEQGRFELKTIRPAGYPGSDLPAHIHVEIESLAEPRRGKVTEVLFVDDPRLTPAARERGLREGFVICEVARDPGGREEVTAEFRLSG